MLNEMFSPQKMLSPTQVQTDAEVAQILLRNIKTVCRDLSKKGTLTNVEQTFLDVLSQTMMSQEIIDRRLQCSVERVVGLNRRQQIQGLQLLEAERKSGVKESRIKRQAHSHGPKTKKNLDFVFDWFHNDCPMVQVDKSRKTKYKNYTVTCAGKKRVLCCEPHILTGTKFEVAKCFLASDVYSNWRKNTGFELPQKAVESCICVCMKQATIHECCCPVCVEFRFLLEAWESQRKIWHKEQKCECTGCTGPKFSAYRQASWSTASFKNTVCCPKKKYAHLALPYLPSTHQIFCSLIALNFVL